jgi:indolepyruvate ferredoxin oxidoreductase alpha subunit
MTGNEALALGALQAGAKVLTGYPGTPSSGALGSLLALGSAHPWLQGRHVEWSVNEKVAFEVATGAAWAGQRALCTMKMSGLNVAYDSVISIAYSGTNGGLVIYVADDPGVSAGMAEQDSRGFALMSDLPMLEPASPAEAYELVQVAFELSERVGSPVFVRLVTAIANSHAPVRIEEPPPPPEREPILERDIAKYTKAGSAICKAQHRDLIDRLAQAGRVIEELGLNRLELRQSRRRSGDLAERMAERETGGLGIVAAGVTAAYLEEGFEIASRFGFEREAVSVLRVVATHPFPTQEVRALLGACDTILVLEELEPHLERGIYEQALKMGVKGRIIGKLDDDTEGGTFSRVGEYGVGHVVQGIGVALGLPIPHNLMQGDEEAEELAAARPITVCAGCPHRGTYMAINQAIRKLRYKKDEVMVTGDIGCTILGMNPPFHTVWNEISMGASVALAQGYVYGGVETPVIATIGDSTFFHAGIAGLINAVQHQVPLTLIIMDNGWTSMTGMQVNPGTADAAQGAGHQRVDIARIVPALGVEQFFEMDPFDLEGSAATIQQCLSSPGVKVVLARQECAIQAMRQGLEVGEVRVETDNCNLCKLCITVTGCPAIDVGDDTVVIDPALCYGCGLCAQVCNRDAIEVGTGVEVERI